ncbi:MAG: hypothetical protein ACYDH1_04075 [Anaerolineaceae bacterium]
MWNWRNEWAIIRSSIPEWEGFVFSSELFWPLNFDREHEFSEGMKPRLSAGRLLIALFFIEFYQKQNFEIRNSVESDYLGIQKLKTDWKSNWQRKVSAEIPFRLRQWEDIIGKVRKSSISKAEFKSQLQIRFMIDCLLLESTMQIQQQFETQLISLDQLLKMNTIEGEFVWDPEIISAFDPNKNWYLFCKLNTAG